jgi:hypothetical protein
MKLELKYILIHFFVAVFLISMGNEVTVSMQYIESIYNEIEHTSDTGQDLEDSNKTKIKIVESLPEYNFHFSEKISRFTSESSDFYKQLCWITNPTPPPEIAG